MMNDEILLRYGCNPHQIPARVFKRNTDLPFKVLNGSVRYINLLDARSPCSGGKALRSVGSAARLHNSTATIHNVSGKHDRTHGPEPSQNAVAVIQIVWNGDYPIDD